MPQVLDTLEGTIAKLWGQMGRDWPNPWWPYGNPSFNDCAAFLSWGLFGLNGNGPYFTLVSGIQYYFQGIGRMRIDSRNIARGDVIGFLWPGSDDNYSHTEMAIGGVDGNGNFQTIGTNSSPDYVAVRVRNISMVVSYARPDYRPVAPPKPKGTIVTNHYLFQDRQDRELKPGGQLFLNNGKSDQNVVGAIGTNYSITPHVEVVGLTPGDSITVTLVWENTANKPPSKFPSFHYPVIGVADESGTVAISPEFKRRVIAGDMVFVRVTAPKTNKSTGKVSYIDCDAYRFN